MELGDLENAIKESWSKDTTYPASRSEWSQDNPALGQCAVTALVVNHYMGGEIPCCKHSHHYWNILSDGREVDLTKSQFLEGEKICLDEMSSRDYLLNSEGARVAKTEERYKILLREVSKKLDFYQL